MNQSSQRILHLVETWQPVTSGYTSRGWEIVSAQANQPGLIPFVITTSRQFLYSHSNPLTPDSLSENVVAISPSPLETKLRQIYPFYTDTQHLKKVLLKFCQDKEINLIHVHWSSSIGVVAAKVAKQLNIPLVAEVRFDLAGAVISETVGFPFPLLEKTLRFWFERYLPQASQVVAASYTLANLVVKTFPNLKSKLTVTPNGVDPNQFQPKQASSLRKKLNLEDKIVLGSTSNMIRYEGLDLLLKALPQIQEQVPNIHVVLVGTGTQYDMLQQQAQQDNLPVTFVGCVSALDVPQYLQLFDIFVIPRRNVAITQYASPIKLLEAMASGLPIISSAVGDIPYLLNDGRGILVSPNSLSQLSEAIVTLAQNKTKRETLGKKARQWIESYLNWDKIAKIYKNIYQVSLYHE